MCARGSDRAACARPLNFTVRVPFQRREMIAASSRFEAPRASKDFTRRSRETVGSPDSIFATRD